MSKVLIPTEKFKMFSLLPCSLDVLPLKYPFHQRMPRTMKIKHNTETPPLTKYTNFLLSSGGLKSTKYQNSRDDEHVPWIRYYHRSAKNIHTYLSSGL